jgi:hypothetical protein
MVVIIGVAYPVCGSDEKAGARGTRRARWQSLLSSQSRPLRISQLKRDVKVPNHRDARSPNATDRPQVDLSKIPYQLPQPAGMIADLVIPGALSLDDDESHWIEQARARAIGAA